MAAAQIKQIYYSIFTNLKQLFYYLLLFRMFRTPHWLYLSPRPTGGYDVGSNLRLKAKPYN